MEEYIQIGRTKKPHGLDGEIKLVIEDRYLEDFSKTEVIFIREHSSYLPFFIQEIRGNQPLIVAFDDVSHIDQAKKIASKEIFLRQQDILTDDQREWEVPSDELEFGFLTGFTMIDETIGELGEINEVLEYPQQEMAVISYQGSEKLVPLNDEIITKHDKEKQIVTVNLPEGLLSL